MTQAQKEIIKNYVLDLIYLIDHEELQFIPGELLFRGVDDDTTEIVKGTIVKNSEATFGLVKDGLFYEGVEIEENGIVLFDMQGEPTKIEELI